ISYASELVGRQAHILFARTGVCACRPHSLRTVRCSAGVAAVHSTSSSSRAAKEVSMIPHYSRRAFALTELLVVLAMLSLVTALALPAMQGARQAAHRRETVNNLRMIGIGIHNYSDTFRRMLPAYAPSGQLKAAAPLHVHILPFVEQQPLYNQFLQQAQGADKAKVVVFLTPEDTSVTGDQANGVQNFAANLRLFSDKIRLLPYKKNAG